MLLLQMDRARIMELRSEAAAEIAGARAKEDRLRSLEAARTEAEARAAAHAADAEIMRLQVCGLLRRSVMGPRGRVLQVMLCVRTCTTALL